MSKDAPDNPFHKLAEALAQRGQKAQKRAAAPLLSKAPEKDRPEALEDDEAAMFLDAVSSIKALGRKGGPRPGSHGHSLAELLKAGQGTGRGAGQSAGRGAGQGVGWKDGQGAGSLSAPDKSPAGTSASDKAPAATLAPNKAPAPTLTKTLPPDQAFAFQDAAASDAKAEDLFARAVQGVRPLSGGGRDLAPGAEKKAAAPGADPVAALREILEGRVDFALRHTDEYQEGFVVGLDPLVLSRLRAGRYSPEKHIDLHGLNARQAHDALTHFIKGAYQRNMRCVVVVTGRGRNSPDGVGVLRPLLQDWLSRDPFKRVVLAFCTAKPGDGGPGAVYVLLRKYKKSRGKIIWERRPGDDDFPDV